MDVNLFWRVSLSLHIYTHTHIYVYIHIHIYVYIYFKLNVNVYDVMCQSCISKTVGVEMGLCGARSEVR